MDPQRKIQLVDVLQFINNASNWELHKIVAAVQSKSAVCYDPIAWFPEIVLDVIVSCLSTEDLLNCMEVNEAWNDFLAGHAIWKRNALTEYDLSECTNEPLLVKQLKAPRSHAIWQWLASASCLLYYQLMSTPHPLLFSQQNFKAPLNVCNPNQITSRGGLACTTDNNSYVVFDVHMNEVLWNTSVDETPSSFRFIHDAPPGRRRVSNKGVLLFGFPSGKLILDQPSGSSIQRRVFFTSHQRVYCSDVSLAYSILASVGQEAMIEVRDLKHGILLNRFSTELHPAHVYILRKHAGFFHIIVISSSYMVTRLSWPDKPPTDKSAQLKKLLSLNNRMNPQQLSRLDLSHAGDFTSIQCEIFPLEPYREMFCGTSYWRVNRHSGVFGAVLHSSNNKEQYLAVIDAYTMTQLYKVKAPMKVIALQAVGRRFGLMLVVSRVLQADDLVLVDLKLEKYCHLASVNKTHRLNQRLICDCPGTSGWLDSIPVGYLLHNSSFTTVGDVVPSPPLYSADEAGGGCEGDEPEECFEDPPREVDQSILATADYDTMLPQTELVYVGPAKYSESVVCVKWIVQHHLTPANCSDDKDKAE